MFVHNYWFFAPRNFMLFSLRRSDMFIAQRYYFKAFGSVRSRMSILEHGAPLERNRFSVLWAINISLLRSENKHLAPTSMEGNA